MAGSSFETKSTTVKRGFKYRYWFAKAKDSKPTLLFFHGFPESKYCYRHQVQFFSEQGYGVICPDLLGYDETDKPNDVQQYIHLEIAKDVVDIADHEGVKDFVVLGHDWGVLPAARTVNAFPERTQAFVLMCAGYFPPSGKWDTPAFCEYSKSILGYESMGYFPWYGSVNEDGAATEPTEATKIMLKNFDSFMSLMFSEDPETWTKHFCPLDKARQYITSNQQGPLNKKISKEEFEHYRKIIRRDLHTNLMWYRCVQLNLQEQPEKSQLKPENSYIKCPFLFLEAENDSACQARLYEPGHKEYMADLTTHKLKTSHWMTMEEPDLVNKYIKEFVDERVKAA